MRTFKRILVILLIVLILIQFFRPARNISASQSPADVSTIYPVSANVGIVLKRPATIATVTIQGIRGMQMFSLLHGG